MTVIQGSFKQLADTLRESRKPRGSFQPKQEHPLPDDEDTLITWYKRGVQWHFKAKVTDEDYQKKETLLKRVEEGLRNKGYSYPDIERIAANAIGGALFGGDKV